MAVVTVKMADTDKVFLQAMAQFEGVSLSELIRTQTFKALEDKYDAKVADEALEEYERYLATGSPALSWQALMAEVGLDD